MYKRENIISTIFNRETPFSLAAIIMLLMLCWNFNQPIYGQAQKATAADLQMTDQIPDRSGGSYINSSQPLPGLTPGPNQKSKLLPPAQETILNTFEGFDFDDNAAETGFFFIPPDAIGAAGRDRVIAVVNVMIEGRDKSGALLYRDALKDFFAPLEPTTFTFDPKIVYDHYNQRFVVVTLERVDTGSNPDPGNISRILLAVSKTSSPADLTFASWHYYAIDAKMNIGGTEHWADYPGFEIDEEAVYITANMFQFAFNPRGYGGARVWIVDKGAGSGGFYDGGPAGVTAHDPYTASGQPENATTTMPALVFGPGGVGGPGSTLGTFLVSYSGLTFGGAGMPEAVQVITIDDPLGNAGFGPIFIHEFVTIGDIENLGGAFGFPPLDDAAQFGSSELIEVLDRRIQDAVWRDDRLWMTTTIEPNSGPDVGQTTAHWIRLDTAPGPGAITLHAEGDIGAEDIASANYTFYPSLAVNSRGDAKFGFSACTQSIFVGAYVAGLRSGDLALQPTEIVHEGEDSYVRKFGTDPRNRWGDYSGTALDPVNDNTFWIFNQYAGEQGSPTIPASGEGRWETAWASCVFDTSQGDSNCVTFNNLAVGTQYGGAHGNSPGDLIFTENGIRVFVEEFQTGVGPFFNTATVSMSGFGSGNYMDVNNINLAFDFSGLSGAVSSVTLDYFDLGGIENIAVNGDPIFSGDISSAPTSWSGGTVTLSFAANKLILNGPVYYLIIGGQEFGLDNVCANTDGCPPDIAVAPNMFNFTVPVGGSDSDILRISNTAPSGCDSLIWSISEQDVTLLAENGQEIPLRRTFTQARNSRASSSSGTSHPAHKDLDLSQYKSDDAGNLLGLNIPAIYSNNSSAAISAKVLFFGGSSSHISRLISLGADITVINNPATITPAFLDNFDVLYVENTYVDDLAGKAFEIRNFVANGCGLIVEQPNQTGPVAIMPAGFEVSVASISFTSISAALTPAAAGHEMTMGLSSSDLSGNFDIVFESDIGASFTILARNASNSNQIALLAGQHGSGRIAFYTGNISLFSIDPGSDIYLEDMVNWAAAGKTGDCTWLTETPTSGIIAAGSYQDVLIEVDATGLAPGDYHCDMVINSNDPDENPVIVPVWLTVVDTTVEVTWCDSVLNGITGTRDTVYICVDDVTGMDIFSYQITVTFDESVLNCVSAGNAGTISSGFNPPVVNCGIPGQLTVGSFGIDPLSGSGPLVCLVFDVVGDLGDSTEICIDDVLFNEGSPTPIIPEPCCPYQVLDHCDIAGQVTYCPTGATVANTTLNLSGAMIDSRVTSGSGNYLFEDLFCGLNYTITPEKSGDFDALSITCFDAALIAMFVAGTDSAGLCESIAADVDENSVIDLTDAENVCSFAIGLPGAHSGEWRFTPASRSYTPLLVDELNQDYLASLLGDVSGNWMPSPSPLNENAFAKSAPEIVPYRYLERLNGTPGEAITIPLMVAANENVISATIDFQYDPTALRFLGVDKTSLSQDFTVLTNNEEGRLRIGAFNSKAVNQPGELLRLNFEITGTNGSLSKLSLERYQLNDGKIQQAEIPFIIGETAIPDRFALYQNYPNPFNPETTIRFDVPSISGQSAKVRIAVYNIAGQLVRVLFDGNRSPGYYELKWDSRDQSDHEVTSGVYFYHISVGTYSATRKMVLLR